MGGSGGYGLHMGVKMKIDYCCFSLFHFFHTPQNSSQLLKFTLCRCVRRVHCSSLTLRASLFEALQRELPRRLRPGRYPRSRGDAASADYKRKPSLPRCMGARLEPYPDTPVGRSVGRPQPGPNMSNARRGSETISTWTEREPHGSNQSQTPDGVQLGLKYVCWWWW